MYHFWNNAPFGTNSVLSSRKNILKGTKIGKLRYFLTPGWCQPVENEPFSVVLTFNNLRYYKEGFDFNEKI